MSNKPAVQQKLRRDGESTRKNILRVAIGVFADEGYEKATSKEICAKARVNSASVNYYFGSKDALYSEVLRVAHDEMVSFETLNTIIDDAAVPPEERLKSVLKALLTHATDAKNAPSVRIFLRELGSPSVNMRENIAVAVLPKVMKVKQLVSEITGWQEGSPELQRATGLVIAPCVYCILAPRPLLRIILNAETPADDNFIDSLLCYILGGLKGLREQAAGIGRDGSPQNAD